MSDRENEIAVVGMGCRLPGARDVAGFWTNLSAGAESISFFPDDELRAAGVPEEDLRDPAFVRAYGSLPDAWAFDAPFFAVNPPEALVMDPQHRVFLECAWTALEDAGVDPARFPGSIAVYAGSGASRHLARVMSHPDIVNSVGGDVAHFANERDFLTTRVSYKLGLRGPSVVVQTACSTSLVAIHLACQSLLNRECDLALAGGVTVSIDQEQGYRYEEGGILSPDGHCRAFDARAAGTVAGSGAGVVVLKRMVDALRDGDPIHAVVKGSAINNDGAGKIGFTAPSVKGQAQAIAEALAVAGVDPADVSYVEAHGTGTPLGDPIEIAALTEVFREGTDAVGACALGAVKASIGHVDAAAGVAGFIKTVLALKHRAIPPTLHFQVANPETGLDGSPFFVNTGLREWETGGRPRIAGVSSFGMGGTNAHVVLEEAPELAPLPPSSAPQVIALAAKSGAALERMRRELAGRLAADPHLPLADVAFTLQEHRAAHPHRWAATVRDLAETREALAGTPVRRPSTRRAGEQPPPVAFLFPGQGTQHAGMARELYEREPVFRRELDRCAEILKPEIGIDLRSVLFPPEGGEDVANAALRRTGLTQPALFAVEYALAKTWMHRGVMPDAMLGHSIGEYVAAHLAGVFTLESALGLVAARGRLMQALPGGAMLAVPLPEAEVRALLPARVSLAAVNSAAHCVVSGETAEMDEIEAALSARGVSARRLHTSHAFHSAAMDPVLDAFAAEVRKARPAAPSLPFLSNVTGDWITAEQAADPGYWVRHLRETVRFADGVGRLLENPSRVLLEVGPGETLGTFARRHSAATPERVIVRSLPRADKPDDAGLVMLDAAAALWTAGVAIDWKALRGGESRRRVPLPTYPFERTVYRVPRPAAAPAPLASDPPRPDPMHNAGTEPAAAPARRSRAAARVTELFAGLLGTDPAQLDAESSFLDLGADSLLLMQASRSIESTLGVRIPFRRMMEELSTPGALAAHLEHELPELAQPEPEPEPEPAAIAPEPVAIAPQPAAEAAPAAAQAVAIPASAFHALPAGDASLQAIVARQLELMQSQIDLLRGAAPSSGHGSNGHATNGHGSNGHGNGGSANGHGSNGHGSNGHGSNGHGNGSGGAHHPTAAAATVKAPERIRAADVAGAAAPGQQPASHGPHRPVSATIGLGGGHDEKQAAYFGEFVRRYNARTRRSKEYAAENRPVLSDNRAALNFRMATKELLYPIVGERSQGSRLWDLDGNEYVDFTIGFGVHFFGHRPAFILDAVDEQLKRGMHLGPQSDLAGPAAKLFSELTGMERVTFCNTGSEAVMTALRIARAATGRDRVVIFEGSYHGCFDGILAARAPGGSDAEPRSRPVAPGTTQGMVDDILVLPYGTPETLDFLRANAAKIAAVLVEPVQSRNPEFHPVEFLRELRALTERAGSVLVFDEMITGLRLEAKGAQGFYGIDADLAVYGKVIGGGFPMGVVAGRARYMDAIDGGQWSFGDRSYPAADQTFFAGTFCKHPVTMAAALAVLRHLQARGPALYEELNARTARLVARLRALLEAEGVPIRIVSCASLFQFRFAPQDPIVDLLFYHMIERGIYIWEGRACFVSTAHTDADCDRLVDALADSIRALRQGGFLPAQGGPGGGGPGGRGDADPDPAPAVPADLKIFPPPEVPADEPRSYPLTPAQRQIWVHAQLGDDASRAYNEQTVFALRGPLDVAALRAALDDVVAHHDSLRTTFDRSGEAQRVRASVSVPFLATAPDGADALDAALAAAAGQAFDLAEGPLLRLHVHARGADDHVVQLVMHHLAADALGAGVLMRDWETAYHARLAGEAPVLPRAMQFGEYAALLAEHAAGHAEHEAGWLERFQGAEPLQLPADRPRPRVPTHRGGTERLSLPAPLVAALRDFGRRERCTLFATLLGALAATLHRVAAQDDGVIGIPSAGRPFPGSESLVGHCVDVLPLRTRADEGTTLLAFLKQVRGWLLDAYEHEPFSYSRLQELAGAARGPAAAPLVSVAFNLEPGGGGAEPRFAGMRMEGVGTPTPNAKFDLNLDAVDAGAEIELVCLYSTDLFDAPTVRRMLGRLRRVLEQAVADAAVPLSSVDLLGAGEREQLLAAWNDTDRPVPTLPVHALFAGQARRAPGATALLHGGQAVTYGALDRRSSALARRLRALGVGPEVPVGLCVERTPELLVAVLGIWKAGGAYVPLDPAYPAERLEFMAADAALRVIVTSGGAAPALNAHGAARVRIDSIDPDLHDGNEEGDEGDAGATAENLAYVIYTSGSTGRPKGVMVRHGSLASHLAATREAFGIAPGDVVPALASYSFDIWLFEALLPLTSGAAVRLVARERVMDVPALLGEIADATLLHAVPALMRQVAAAERERPRLAGLRTAVVGGDLVPAGLPAEMRAAFPSARLHVLYGPTEATILASAHRVPDDGSVQGHPIGRPLGNVRLYVCDAGGAPQPVGTPGELLIGGEGVARGYLGRAALTAEKFVPDPFGGRPGARLYRTGDRARWRGDGTLEFFGRLDQQVKIRGFRVEPGEIEAALRRDPAVRDCVVVVRDDAAGERQLVAYVAGQVEVDALRAGLRRTLPEHMVPAAFVVLDRLPLSPNGKLDRKALPAPDFAAPDDAWVAPRTPVEEVLAAIWAGLLRLERVGTADSFFERGGHSLLATRLASRVRETFGVEMGVREVFDAPTIAELAERIEVLRREDAPALPPVAPADRSAPLAASFAQERLWFLDRLQPGGASYNIPLALRLSGELDAAALERALGEIVRRHESLRTTFAEMGGAPVQVVAPFSGFRLPVHDVADEAEIRARAESEAARPFDLATGPLFRATLLRRSDAEHVLLLTVHHVVGDGWSLDLLFRELRALYGAYREGAASPLPDLPLQYADYAAWQREQLRGQALERPLAWWKERLAGAPALLELPTDRPRPAVQSFRGAHREFELPAGLAARLEALGRREGATLFMVLLGAFQVLLAKYAGTDDVVVGTPIAGRTRRETEELVGLFVNTLALRADLSGDPAFREVLQRVREATLGAYEHQEVPFERLVAELSPERSLGHSPLFQVMFTLNDGAGAARDLPGLRVEGVEAGAAETKFDLTLFAAAGPEGIRGVLGYAADLFEPATAARMLAHWVRVLEQVAGDADVRLSRLELAGADERRAVRVWGRGPELAAGLPVHRRFEEQAARTPDAAAVACAGERLTYGQLNARANRIAHRLRALGVGPEARVAIALERSPEMVAAVLGVLKAGGAYVPLDPAYPAERLEFMLADSAVAVLVTQESVRPRLSIPPAVAVVSVDGEDADLGGDDENPRCLVVPENLAYVIYTSGSTGRPKGVGVVHGGLASYAAWAVEAYGEGGCGAPVHSSLSFDLTVTSLFVPLLTGKTVTLVPESAGVDGLGEALRAGGGFTLVKLTPAHLELLSRQLRPEEMAGRARTFVVGGEQLLAETVAPWHRHAPETAVVNEYGPTETVVGCSVFRSTPETAAETGAVAIGRPVANTALYVLDGNLNPVPAGVPGELYVGGAAVARGYLGRPALTAAAFVPDPSSAQPGARMYRTGDRVRWKESAEVRECGSALDPRENERTPALTHSRTAVLEFLGRADDQVKIRGFRIEPGEVEAALRREPGVAECAVIAREDGPGGRALVAYVAGGADPDGLRDALRRSLPEHMVPSAIVALDRLPLTPNGKLDRRALPAPGHGAACGQVAPRTPAEQVLAGIWAEVLGVERVGAGENFFELGGHSLLAIRVVARVREAFGIELPVRALFEAPQVAALARRVEEIRDQELPPPPPLAPQPRDGRLPLSFGQERLWFVDRLEGGSPFYNMHDALRLSGALDAAALERALGEIVRRHETLRTAFVDTGDGPVQVIAPFQGYTLPVEDLSALPARKRRAKVARRVAADAELPFDLAAGPLFRAALLRLGEEEHVLLLCVHHIVSDGWSLDVLFRELGALYAAFRDGLPSPLPELPVQYADFAAWQRRRLSGPVLERQLAWWKERLAGAPALLELPTDRPRTAERSWRGSHEPVSFPPALARRLEALARGEGATLYMVLLAAFQVLLGRYAGSDDVVVGSPIAGRDVPGVEGLVGFFINALAMRADLSGDPAFRQLLGRVRAGTLDAYEHQEIPFEKLVAELQPERATSHSPVFQVTFTFEAAGEGAAGLGGLEVERVEPDADTTRWDLTLALGAGAGGIAGQLFYSTDLFERSTIRRMLAHLERLLEQVAADPDVPLSRLELLGDEERALVVHEWNRTDAPSASDRCLHQLFEAQVKTTPGDAAILAGDETVTYARLEARANRVAHRLLALGVAPEERVALAMEPSPDCIAALLGILKAGAAYVAMDLAAPDDRIAFMLNESAVRVVVADAAQAGRAWAAARTVVELDGALARLPGLAPAVPVTPRHLAYVVYTSGSTGIPKGVLVEHGGVSNAVAAFDRIYSVTPGSRVLLFAPLHFDASVMDIFTALTTGSALVVAPRDELIGDALVRLMERHRVTHAKFTPSSLAATPFAELPDLRVVSVGGEVCSAELVARWAPGRRFFNNYGPTETSVRMSTFEASNGTVPPPIAAGIDNVRVYVLDEAGAPLPVGVPGEVCIGGVQVARGYLARPALTAQRFVPDPFSGVPGARLYRSGDRMRWKGDGTLEFVGRIDHQVKIRGFRIELGEIEAVLRRHPDVAGAVVVAREDTPGDKRIVAYVAGGADAGELRTHLRRALPEYMVPAAFVALGSIPLTSNGKVDRGALPAPDFAAAEEAYVAPRTMVEEVLAGIWSEVLGVDRVGADDSFFELGGHSLLIMQLITRIRAAFAADLPIRIVFTSPTLGAMAEAVERRIYEDILQMPEDQALELAGLDLVAGD
ncbi:non-ribosomal peptide synthetase/type I polyketide synthase [Longimicrobium sp.]|uniref:non-ribosomal peptide synthetase/type I polyketide synthase n=1 Tax=Longimicrobium sp. TaxID=2029185 RepID=UPI002C7E02F0|nr:non-ribosomal peptide synthetase/type I polyketide synthase [Longimicrobium sp.]HSU12938.1 amino acid adenylation domain-containing protein [Longimicrobium sp.]